MSSQPAPIVNPTSRTAIVKETAQKVRPEYKREKIRVFSPKHLIDDVEAFGTYFRFEPFSVVEVGDIRQYPRDEKNRLILKKKPVIIAEARQVADFIVSSECRGAHHFIILRAPEGTPECESEKQEATQQWIAVYLEQSEQEISGWERFVSEFRIARAGSPPPIMPKHIKRAYDFRASYAAGLIGRKEFICMICSADFDTIEDYNKHASIQHPGAGSSGVGPMTPSAPPPAPMLAPVKAIGAQGPSLAEEKRRKEAERKGAAILARANDIGLPLSVADKKGLQHGDKDVIADVTQRFEKELLEQRDEERANVPPGDTP